MIQYGDSLACGASESAEVRVCHEKNGMYAMGNSPMLLFMSVWRWSGTSNHYMIKQSNLDNE